MGRKSSSNKPSKAGQRDRTERNKQKHKKMMTEQYVKKHGSTDGMPDWDAKPNFEPKKQRIVREFIVSGKKTYNGRNVREVL